MAGLLLLPDLKMTPPIHAGLALAGALPAAWATLMFRRRVQDPDALRKTLLPDPESPPGSASSADEDED